MTKSILESAIYADPMLCRRVQHLEDAKRNEIKAFILGLDALIVDGNLFGEVAPNDQYFELNCWQLSMFAQHGPKDVDLLNLVLVREEILAPIDEPGQAELRSAITLGWLRGRLGELASSN